ncbi:hypothetical protein HOY82DRAFT_566207 [Tuber indicum]|nr:hypothetical protein HOY82DRAFT_566207 [Tuber indicum]
MFRSVVRVSFHFCFRVTRTRHSFQGFWRHWFGVKLGTHDIMVFFRSGGRSRSLAGFRGLLIFVVFYSLWSSYLFCRAGFHDGPFLYSPIAFSFFLKSIVLFLILLPPVL